MPVNISQARREISKKKEIQTTNGLDEKKAPNTELASSEERIFLLKANGCTQGEWIYF